MNLPPFNKGSWLFDKLSDNNASDDGLSLSASVAVEGTVHWYWSHAITHYFTGGEIIRELKVCMILWYLRKDGNNIHSQVGRPWGGIQEDITAWINVSVFKRNISKGCWCHWLTFCFLHIANNIILNTICAMPFRMKSLLGLYLGWFMDKHALIKNFQKH